MIIPECHALHPEALVHSEKDEIVVAIDPRHFLTRLICSRSLNSSSLRNTFSGVHSASGSQPTGPRRVSTFRVAQSESMIAREFLGISEGTIALWLRRTRRKVQDKYVSIQFVVLIDEFEDVGVHPDRVQ